MGEWDVDTVGDGLDGWELEDEGSVGEREGGAVPAAMGFDALEDMMMDCVVLSEQTSPLMEY